MLHQSVPSLVAQATAEELVGAYGAPRPTFLKQKAALISWGSGFRRFQSVLLTALLLNDSDGH